MSLLSALSGKTHQINSLFLPIAKEYQDRIDILEDNVERFVLFMSLHIAKLIIIALYHPDKGLFRNSINELDIYKVRKIYEIIIMHEVVNMATGNHKMDSVSFPKAYEYTKTVLNLSTEQIDTLYSIFKDKTFGEKMTLLWESICRNSNTDLTDLDHLQIFAKVYKEAHEVSND